MRTLMLIAVLTGCAGVPIDGAPKDVEGLWCRIDGVVSTNADGAMSMRADGAVQVGCASSTLEDGSVVGFLGAVSPEFVNGTINLADEAPVLDGDVEFVHEDDGAWASGWITAEQEGHTAEVVFDGWAPRVPQ